MVAAELKMPLVDGVMHAWLYNHRKAASTRHMKILRSLPLVAGLIAFLQNASGQGFINLDFENPILPLGPIFGQVHPSNAVPGWAVYFGGGRFENVMFYDRVSGGGSIVALVDNNNVSPKPIQGNYSVLLYGASSIYAPPDEQFSSSIGQTGTIPTTAQTLTFWCNQSQFNGSSLMQVTFNGLPIDYLVMGSTANYTIYEAGISAYAGQTGQLLFTTPVNTSAFLDNIQFSSIVVPEPSAFALTALGAFLFGLRRRKNSSR